MIRMTPEEVIAYRFELEREQERGAKEMAEVVVRHDRSITSEVEREQEIENFMQLWREGRK